MSDTPATAATDTMQPQVRVITQYVRDFSIENPNFERLLGGPVENPNIKVEVNAGARKLPPNNVFESSISVKATASNKLGTLYDMELDYAGIFMIENIPQQSLEPFLLINCPTLLFPYARRIIGDMTREAGFPPLLLDPIDFGRMFMDRNKQPGT